MSQQSAVVVADEVELPRTFPNTTRNITLTIDSDKGQMKVDKPARLMGNGNLVLWRVNGMPAGHALDIHLETATTPVSLSRAVTTTAQSHIQTNDSAPPLAHNVKITITYSVYIRNMTSGASTKLQHVDEFAFAGTPLPNPYLIIDRMGDPPPDKGDPEGKPE